MKEQLEISSFPGCFAQLYDQIANAWEKRATEILSDSFIAQTLENCYALKPWREQILEAAAQLRENKALCLLVCLLEVWIAEGGVVSDKEYVPPKGDGLAYDFLHLFPAIPTMPASVDHLRKRGVPEDVVEATMGEYDFCVNMCLERQGRPLFDRGRLNWITRVITNRLIRIGRFKYDLPDRFMQGVRVYRNAAGEVVVFADDLQIHSSGRVLGSVGHTEEENSFFARITESGVAVIGHKVIDGIVEKEVTSLDKQEWTLCLSSKDAFPRIHIPSDGSFDRETVAASYQRARQVFDTCYPDYPYKGFFCSSWLMSTDLRKVLKPTSNILAFQEPFTHIPWRSSGRLVFSFAFGMDAAIPENIAALPEKTSLQRAVKQLYLKGEYIHEGAGFFL